MRGSAARAIAVIVTATAFAACRDTPGSVPPSAARLNVLLVTIDTLRADRLGTGVAPTLDRLAATGLNWTSARSAVPLTLPSHTTILTGLLPPAHGVRENGSAPLASTHRTIAELLKEKGYRTAAFVGAFVLDRRFGLARGFDTYDDAIPRDPNATEKLEAERPASAVVEAALGWLQASAPQPAVPTHEAPGTQHPAPTHPAPTHPAPSTQHQAPFFVWLHLYDPHAPYHAPTHRADATTIPQRYDEEVSYADSQLARVFAFLKERQLDRDTIVVVADDHGEGLGEHGEQTHGMLLYDSTLRVPLIVSAPGHAPSRRDTAVSLTDIAPTILRATGVEPPAAMLGRDLLTDPARSNRKDEPDVYAETEYPHVAGWSPLQALTDGRWKTIRAGAATEVYDVQNDVAELRNVASAQQTVATAMSARIESVRARSANGGPAAISDEARERLRALGYVASSGPPTVSANAANPASAIAAWNLFEETLSVLTVRPADALTPLARLTAQYPEAPVFQTTYARALKDAGRAHDALAAYRSAARRWPTDAALLHDLSVALRDAANRTTGASAAALQKEAIDADIAALALTPSSATARNGLGLLAVDQQRFSDAVREFRQATDLDPNNASYWTNLGNAQRAAGDSPSAEQAYRKALAVDGRSADAANGLGVLLVEARRPAEAVPLLERVVTAAPDFVEARLNLGIALQQSGDTKRAAEAYRAVIASHGNHPREQAAARALLAALETSR